MKIIEGIKSLINPFNIDIIKYPNLDLRRRKKLFDFHKIERVLDIGANTGQYAILLRKIGFKGSIISFEPLSAAFASLQKKTKKDPRWEAHNIAFGAVKKKGLIHISKNSYSSSILEIMPEHIETAEDSSITGTEEINIETLDNLYHQFTQLEEKVLLKLDVQGSEKDVLDGALKALPKITGIQIEMSLVELYKGEMLFSEMISLLEKYGFKLYSLENGFYNNESGKLLQVDGLFFRS